MANKKIFQKCIYCNGMGEILASALAIGDPPVIPPDPILVACPYCQGAKFLEIGYME